MNLMKGKRIEHKAICYVIFNVKYKEYKLMLVYT